MVWTTRPRHTERIAFLGSVSRRQSGIIRPTPTNATQKWSLSTPNIIRKLYCRRTWSKRIVRWNFCIKMCQTCATSTKTSPKSTKFCFRTTGAPKDRSCWNRARETTNFSSFLMGFAKPGSTLPTRKLAVFFTKKSKICTNTQFWTNIVEGNFSEVSQRSMKRLPRTALEYPQNRQLSLQLTSINLRAHSMEKMVQVSNKCLPWTFS